MFFQYNPINISQDKQKLPKNETTILMTQRKQQQQKDQERRILIRRNEKFIEQRNKKIYVLVSSWFFRQFFSYNIYFRNFIYILRAVMNGTKYFNCKSYLLLFGTAQEKV